MKESNLLTASNWNLGIFSFCANNKECLHQLASLYWLKPLAGGVKDLNGVSCQVSSVPSCTQPTPGQSDKMSHHHFPSDFSQNIPLIFSLVKKALRAKLRSKTSSNFVHKYWVEKKENISTEHSNIFFYQKFFIISYFKKTLRVGGLSLRHYYINKLFPCTFSDSQLCIICNPCQAILEIEVPFFHATQTGQIVKISDQVAT